MVRGYGPCNKDRMKVRRQAQEEGKWVVEAGLAYDAKQKLKKAA